MKLGLIVTIIISSLLLFVIHKLVSTSVSNVSVHYGTRGIFFICRCLDSHCGSG